MSILLLVVGVFPLSVVIFAWDMLMPPLWFWLLDVGLGIIYIYLFRAILTAEKDGYSVPTVEERLRWEITKMKFFEAIAWFFLATGVIIDVYGILNLHPIIISGAGVLIVGSYLVATHYRKKRFKRQEELEKN